MRWIAVAIGMILGMSVGLIRIFQDLILRPPPTSIVHEEPIGDYLPLYLAGTGVFTLIGGVLGFVVGLLIGSRKSRRGSQLPNNQ